MAAQVIGIAQSWLHPTTREPRQVRILSVGIVRASDDSRNNALKSLCVSNSQFSR